MGKVLYWYIYIGYRNDKTYWEKKICHPMTCVDPLSDFYFGSFSISKKPVAM